MRPEWNMFQMSRRLPGSGRAMNANHLLDVGPIGGSGCATVEAGYYAATLTAFFFERAKFFMIGRSTQW